MFKSLPNVIFAFRKGLYSPRCLIMLKCFIALARCRISPNWGGQVGDVNHGTSLCVRKLSIQAFLKQITELELSKIDSINVTFSL